MPDPQQQQQQQSQPTQQIPASPLQAGWFGFRWLTTANPAQVIVVSFGLMMALFVGLFGMVYYDARSDRIQARQEYTETILQLRRDRDSLEDRTRQYNAERDEKWKAHELDVVKIMNTNCQNAEKIRREIADKHMQDAMSVLRDLKVEIARLRGAKVEQPPAIPEQSPAPHVKTEQP